ncbi:MAG: 1-phosphofructokinase [Oscillospiraceae bacterium]|jgi:1-phosphofructokinase|nr:1-phosphofructokinase [Oscillospiraceae bacterium]MDD3260401.1 1-phosphofructokinase [Oscillospiraceae bacterium]
MIYTVTFNPAIDYVVHLKGNLQPGKINRCADETYQFGGKGINVAALLRNLGYDAIALGFIAGETGSWLQKGLRSMNILTDFISLPSGMTRVNVKVKAGGETEINGSGPVISPADMEKLYTRLDALKSGDVLVLAGSIPACLANDTYEKIMARLAGRSILIAVDATQDLLVNVLRYRPFLIKPNNHELSEIFGRELQTDREIAECARKLQERGARNVLVSMGKDGALLLDETGKTSRMAAPKCTVRNSVGAGDSMVAGFLAGWLQTGSYFEALRLGSAAGSATAASLGLATKDEIDAMLAKL